MVKSVAEALAWADVVILAIPGPAVAQLTAEHGASLHAKLVIDAATPHESKVDYVAMPEGQHNLRVEYNQTDGWIELRVEIIRGRPEQYTLP